MVRHRKWLMPTAWSDDSVPQRATRNGQRVVFRAIIVLVMLMVAGLVVLATQALWAAIVIAVVALVVAIVTVGEGFGVGWH